MRDRKLELGSYRALGAELGMSASVARRLTVEGPPRSWTLQETEDFVAQLYWRAKTVSETRDPGAKAELERRRKLPVYALEARIAAGENLRRVVFELEGRRPCESGTWSPRAALARELGLVVNASVRLGRWLERGRVPAEFMPQYASWAEDRALRAIQKQREQAQIEELIEEAKRPERQHALTGQGGTPRWKACGPNIKTGEERTESEQQSGYLWRLRVEEWSSFELIAKLCEWARTRVRPRGQAFAESRNWIVTALCNVYDRESSRKGRKKSPGAYREFSGQRKKERGTHLQLNVPVSSRTVKVGGLARAVRLFEAEMTAEHCESEYVYVQGLMVRNWRWRSEAQRKNYRDLVRARIENETALAFAAIEKKRAVIRAGAKKKALGRRGSAASARKKKAASTPVGARPRGKKRS